jgi:hypothetical protein
VIGSTAALMFTASSMVTLPDEGNGLPEREAVFLTFGPSRLRLWFGGPDSPVEVEA